MFRQYDWYKLKSEFISGNWLTITTFFKEKSIRNNSYSRSCARGWLQERRLLQERLLAQAQEDMIETEAKMRVRQQKIAKQLQLKGLAQLQNAEIKNAEDARKLITTGMQEERKALGLEGNETALRHLSRPSPLTDLDDFIEKLTYVEMVELMSEIKRMEADRLNAKRNTQDADM